MPDPGTLFKKKPESREIAGLSAAATDEPVAEIQIVGNKLVPTTQILNEMQTRVGRPYDPVMVQRDVRKLAMKAWFVSVEPQVQQSPNGKVVVIKVVERPTIRYVEYLGNKGIRDTKLAKETGPQGRRLDRSLRGRRLPPQDHRSLQDERLQRRAGHDSRG